MSKSAHSSRSRLAPILDHPLEAPTAFRPEDLVASVRALRSRDAKAIPEMCVLEFDGDLTDKLLAGGQLTRCDGWPCFHTTMWRWESDGLSCGLIARTIGGPFTVLVAEQLAVCGVRLIVGLASAGRVSSSVPLPSIVLADRAIRDEGTSYHYLPPAETVEAPPGPLPFLEAALGDVGLPLRRGLVWTTDAPYRETAEQIARHEKRGALAVEMQAASLFAFGQRAGVAVALVAHLTNATDHEGEQFEKGPPGADVQLLRAICRGGRRWIDETAR
ncbi:MAG: hypothetical protein BIFFINMI_04262 [Phycisphaerae bacterium]|nr:hypothetical protein [Phycisphaerae bacterium]